MGHVERSVCVLGSEQVALCWSASTFCSVASWRVLRSVYKLQSLVFATSGGFAQFDKLRENV